jgi:hypothetical protein
VASPLASEVTVADKETIGTSSLSGEVLLLPHAVRISTMPLTSKEVIDRIESPKFFDRKRFVSKALLGCRRCPDPRLAVHGAVVCCNHGHA